MVIIIMILLIIIIIMILFIIIIIIILIILINIHQHHHNHDDDLPPSWCLDADNGGRSHHQPPTLLHQIILPSPRDLMIFAFYFFPIRSSFFSTDLLIFFSLIFFLLRSSFFSSDLLLFLPYHHQLRLLAWCWQCSHMLHVRFCFKTLKNTKYTICLWNLWIIYEFCRFSP